MRALLIPGFLLLLSSTLCAQPPYLVRHYGVAEGLSNEWISDLYQDRKGFVWIATQYGLNRFDGLRFKTYTYSPVDSNGLIANWVQCLLEDSEGYLWVGVFGNGLNRLDPRTGEFEKYIPASDFQVTALCAADGGALWIGTSTGLWSCLPKTGEFKKQADLSVNDLAMDSEGVVWVAAENGLYRVAAPGEPLVPLPELKGRFIGQVRPTQDGVIWLHDLQKVEYLRRKGASFELGSTGIDPGAHPDGHFFTPLFEDAGKQLWIGGRNEPKIIADGRIKEILPLTPSLESFVTSFLEDRQGNIWVGTSRGYYILSSKAQRFRDPRYEAALARLPNVRETLFDGSAFWFATFNGLYCWTPGQPFPSKPLLAQSVYSLLQGSDGAVYAGTISAPAQLVRFEPGSRRISMPAADSIFERGNIILCMAEDRAGRIWIGAGRNLRCYDPHNGVFLHIPASTRNGLTNDDFMDLLTDRAGNLWVGTLSGGLFCLPNAHRVKNPGDAHFEHYRHDPKNPNSLSSDIVMGLHESTDSMIWIGTDGGLNRFEPKAGVWRRFLRSDGMPDDKIFALRSDASGRIWMSTAGHGLVCYDQENDRFFNFTTEDGLSSNSFLLSSVFQTPEGLLMFGSEAGLQIFNPDRVFPEKSEGVELVAVGGEIAGRKGKGRRFDFLPEPAPHIVLEPGDQTLTLRFAALHFFQPEKTEYAYQLEGFHDGWVSNGAKPEITFTNLSPGTYRLLVRAFHPNENWQTSAMPIEIKVRAPWYRRWWAWLLYATALTLGVAKAYRFQINRRLAQAENKRLKDLDSAKTKMFTHISHEFRTPLTIILGLAAEFEKPSAQRDTARYAQIIGQNGRHLLDLVNQMLDLAKLEAGVLNLRYIRGDVSEFLRYIASSFQSLAKSKGLQLHFLQEQADYDLDYDPDKLLKITSNLLANAIAYTPSGGHVYARLKATDQNFTFGVRDTGVGISEVQLPHIFDPFYRAETPENSPGSGIGLALVKELVQALGGKIAVYSKPGEGSLFEVELPLRREAPAADMPLTAEIRVPVEMQSVRESSDPQKAIFGEKPFALLVEDNADVVRYLQICLEEVYETAVAQNGRDGLEIAVEMVPDVIVSDVMMPEMDGFEFCRRVKQDERTNHIPVILLTAKADFSAKLEGLEQGADAYLIKPFEKAELLVQMRKLRELRAVLHKKYQGATPPPEASAEREDPFVEKVRSCLEKNLADDEYSIEQLAREVHLSRVQLYRKLLALTGLSPTFFIRRIRLEHARKMLLSTHLSVSEIGFRVGFKDPAYFSRVFSEEFGMPPGQFR